MARRPVAYQRLSGGAARARRWRYSASMEETLTPADFRTLTPAEALSWLEAQGFAHARGTNAWLDSVAGMWAEIDGASPLVTDRGLAVPGAVTQYVPNTECAGAVIGLLSGAGALPTGWTLVNNDPSVAVEVTSFVTLLDGRPQIIIEGESATNGIGGLQFMATNALPAGYYWCGGKLAVEKLAGAGTFALTVNLTGGTGGYSVTSDPTDHGETLYKATGTTEFRIAGDWYTGVDGSITVAVPQCFGLPFDPGILVRGSGTEPIASAAEQIQRTVTASATFHGAIQAIAAAGIGAPGTVQWLWQRANIAGTEWVGIYRDADDSKVYYSVMVGGSETRADLGTLENT